MLVVLSEGKWFSYLFSDLRKINYKLEKKENFRYFLHPFTCRKQLKRKKSWRHFQPKTLPTEPSYNLRNHGHRIWSRS